MSDEQELSPGERELEMALGGLKPLGPAIDAPAWRLKPAAAPCAGR